MTPNLLIELLLLVALIGWIGYRQSTWRAVVPGRMLRTPIVLGIVGLVLIATAGAAITGLDLALLSLQIVVSLGVGAVMGAIAVFRPISDPALVAALAKRGASEVPALESRTGWFGLALWIVLIGLRIGLDVWGSTLGSHLGATTGAVLLMLAVNRLARAGVIALRAEKLAAVAA